MTTIPRRRIRAVATGFAAALALVLATAAPAGASVNITTSGPYTHTQTVTITGTAPTGTTRIAVAECNISGVTTPPTYGTACDISTAIAPTSAPLTGTSYSVGFTLVESWAPNWNLSTGSPVPDLGSSTDCDTIGPDPCAIVVSYYGTGGFITAEYAALTFV